MAGAKREERGARGGKGVVNDRVGVSVGIGIMVRRR